MSRSQFQSKRFILRHAWLNLWDERMTTGRINQVAIFVVAPTSNSQRTNACVLRLMLHSNHRQRSKLTHSLFSQSIQWWIRINCYTWNLFISNQGHEWSWSIQNRSSRISPRFTFLKPTWTYPDNRSYHAESFLDESKQSCSDARKQVTWQQALVKCCAHETENFISWQKA